MRHKAPDLTWQRFGRLIAVSPLDPARMSRGWLCQCDCGRQHTVKSSIRLTQGNTKSCGCLRDPQPVRDRLEANSCPEPNTGCWLWTGALDKDGYAKFTAKSGERKYWRGHIASYEEFIGPVPEGLELDHLCRTKSCINPVHLEPVTGYENMRRGTAWTFRLAITHCPKGHEYDEQNTYRSESRHRQCRACHAATEASRRAAKKEAKRVCGDAA